MRKQVYIAYHSDEKDLADQLHLHLRLYKRGGLLVFDPTRDLQGGDNHRERRQVARDCSRVVVLLLSAGLLDDDFLNEVLAPLTDAVRRGEVVLLPVIARAVDYAQEPLLKDIHLALDPGRPLDDVALRDLAARVGELCGVRRVALDLPYVPPMWLRPPRLYGLALAALTLLVVSMLLLGNESLVCRALLIGLPARELSFPLIAALRAGLVALPVLLHGLFLGLPILGVGEERSMALVPFVALGIGNAVRWRCGRILEPSLLVLALALMPAVVALSNALRAHHALVRVGIGGNNCYGVEVTAMVCSWLYNGGDENQGRQAALAGLFTLSLLSVCGLLGLVRAGARRSGQAAQLILGMLFVWLLTLAPWAVALGAFRNEFPRVRALAAECPVQLPPDCVTWDVSGAAEQLVLVVDRETCPGFNNTLILSRRCAPVTDGFSPLFQVD